MKYTSSILFGYAILLLIGGLIGFLKSNSITSLITSSVLFIILFMLSLQVKKLNITCYYASLSLLALLQLFFIYRFFLTFKFMPAGAMGLLTLSTLLAIFRKKGVRKFAP